MDPVPGPPPRESTGPGAQQLVEMALSALPTFVHPDGEFCFHRVAGRAGLEGRSYRYSAIVGIGLRRARLAKMSLGPLDDDFLEELLFARLAEATPGDVGLVAWMCSRGATDAEGLLNRFRKVELNALHRLPTMEAAWLVLGAAHMATRGDAGWVEQADRWLAYLRSRLVRPTGLFLHYQSKASRRARFANFATEVYALMALATVANAPWAGERRRSVLPEARQLADVLLDAQRVDGGWPWLYDAHRGTVVEDYEIYSVHQNAMAPIAMIEMFEATGDRRYLDAMRKGLSWSLGNNELGSSLYAHPNFVYRSIRRRSPISRIVLAANTAASLAHLPGYRGGFGHEMNCTWRPYEPGWVLEAFAGRAGVADPNAGSSTASHFPDVTTSS